LRSSTFSMLDHRNWDLYWRSFSIQQRISHESSECDHNHVALSAGQKRNLNVLPLPTNNFISPSRFWLKALFRVPIIVQLFWFRARIFKRNISASRISIRSCAACVRMNHWIPFILGLMNKITVLFYWVQTRAI
jgi:hypothetical protein